MAANKKSLKKIQWESASLTAEFEQVFPISTVQYDNLNIIFGRVENLSRVAPAFFEVIKSMVPKTIKVAEINPEIQRLIDEGIYKFLIDKNGEIVEIGKLTTAKTLEQLKDEFSETSILLSKISDSAISFPEEIKTVDFSEDDENVIISLLSLEIEKPELADREKEILAAVEKGMQAQLESAREVFKEDNVGICPYCYQKVDKSYKQEFVASIDKVLNHDVDAHIEALKRVKLPIIVFDKQKYASLDAALSTDIEKKIIICNQDIDEYKKLIIKKTENTYTPISRKASLSNLIRELNVLLTRLEKARKGYLDASKRKKALSDKLLETNRLIASKSISDDYGTYIKQQKTHDTLKANILQKEQEIKSIMEKIKQQNEVKWKTGIAIQKINKALEYIFFSKDRLSIELKNDLYYLKSNDKDVKPRDISSGERNIIALCYFFIEIAANQEVDKLYHKEQLLVIDDPVSSFDFENRVGILSYLKSQMKSVVFCNSNSKIILLSHDLTTIFDLQKAADEIQKATKVNDQLANANWGWQELYDKKLIQFAKKRNEYSALLSLVYSYAHDKSGADSLNIGNYMRRTMEAFSTFSYKKSIEDLSCDAGVIGMLGEKSDFFEHLMYRLVLHGESHSEERVKSLHSDNNFFDFVSDDEKQKTARRILCLMYSLNPQHIQAHIEHAINDIKKWCEEIPVNDEHDAQEQIVDYEAISLRTIRLYGRVSAGVGIESIYDIPFAEHETANDRGDYALEIDGDSMEPDLPNGSIVLVKACEELPEGAIGVFLYDGKLYCKTRKYIDGETYLFSKNPIYQPIHIDSEKQGKIQGQVLGIDE